MDSGTAVMVRDLRKSYRDVTAIRGIDLEITTGEVFALLGPNGAGKTTTVEILEGFRRRDQGTVTVLGQDPAQAGRAWRARIGIVLQLASAGPELTVLEMVRHFAAFYPFWALIKTLRGDGTTIVLTTHYLDEAEALADRIAVIAAGRIVAEGDPGSLGGRSAAAARVSWETPGGERSTVATGTPTQTIAELAREFGGEIPGLTVTRPTLEEIYLDLIAAAEGEVQPFAAADGEEQP